MQQFEDIIRTKNPEELDQIQGYLRNLDEVPNEYLTAYMAQLFMVIHYDKTGNPDYYKWFKYNLSKLLFEHFDDDQVVSFVEHTLEYFEVTYPKDSPESDYSMRIIDEIKSFLSVTTLRRKKIRKCSGIRINYFII